MTNWLLRYGLISMKERWWLTIKGFGLILLFTLATFSLMILKVHSFLAISKPDRSAQMLIIDGPIPEYAVEPAIMEFQQGGYHNIVTTGGPISRGYMVSDASTYPELVAAALINQKFDSNKIVVIQRELVVSDRTYANAVSFKKWHSDSGLSIRSVNVFSMGTHARRTRLLYQMALGESTSVGIIAVDNIEYQGDLWWKSSVGFRNVIGESIAYLYARFIFSTPA